MVTASGQARRIDLIDLMILIAATAALLAAVGPLVLVSVGLTPDDSQSFLWRCGTGDESSVWETTLRFSCPFFGLGGYGAAITRWRGRGRLEGFILGMTLGPIGLLLSAAPTRPRCHSPVHSPAREIST